MTKKKTKIEADVDSYPADEVHHPRHYNQGKIECIEFLEDQKLGFHLGNAVKYITRAGKKDASPEGELKDLDKAIWYLRRYRELTLASSAGIAPRRPNEMGKQ